LSARVRLWPLLGATSLLFGACEGAQEEPAPAPTAARTVWHGLGAWSGSGDRQTESFDVTTGALRLSWEARDEDTREPGRLRVALHSSISGRPLETIVDTDGAGADTAYVAADPRVAYLLIESDAVDWSLTLEEAVTVASGSGSARGSPEER
jgi:hypothetical protein